MKYFKVLIIVCLVVFSGFDKNENKGPTGPSHGLSAEKYLPLKGLHGPTKKLVLSREMNLLIPQPQGSIGQRR